MIHMHVGMLDEKQETHKTTLADLTPCLAGMPISTRA